MLVGRAHDEQDIGALRPFLQAGAVVEVATDDRGTALLQPPNVGGCLVADQRPYLMTVFQQQLG